MQVLIDFKRRAIWIAALLASLMFVHGQAGADLLLTTVSKDEAKCLNTLNAGGAKVAKAQGKENTSCVKNFGKNKTDKLGPPPATAESCLTADVKKKVKKASDKVIEKGGDKCAAQNPTFGATDPNTRRLRAPRRAAMRRISSRLVFRSSSTVIVQSVPKPGGPPQASVSMAEMLVQYIRAGQCQACPRATGGASGGVIHAEAAAIVVGNP